MLRIRSGDVVTVAMVVSGKPQALRVHMRFRSGGVMVSRLVGEFGNISQAEALAGAWRKVREDRIAEQNEWAWLEP